MIHQDKIKIIIKDQIMNLDFNPSVESYISIMSFIRYTNNAAQS